MKLVGFFFILSTLEVSEGIKVLTTDSNLVLPPRLGEAEIVNSSLYRKPEISICLRFKTFQYSNYGKPWYSQSVVTYGDTTTLYAYIGTDCEEKFQGCTLRYKTWVDNWAHGRPFGYFWEHSQSLGYYPSWRPGVWNHGCIIASDSGGYIEININGDTVYRNNHYMNTFSRLDHNIVLMNDGGYWEGSPMHGAMTDVTVWSRTLTREEMVGWYFCNTTTTGDVINWQTVTLNIEQLNLIEMDKSKICMREEGPVFKTFKIKKNFDDTSHFCRTINGKLAVAEDIQKYRAMNESFLQTCSSSSQFFTGYQKQDDIWLDANSGAQREFTNWAEGFPTNYFGYDCSYSAPDLKVRDYVCTAKTCPICQVKPTDFILRGVCLDSAVDKFYVTERFDYFLGYINSRMIFNDDSQRWEIVNNTEPSQVLAYMESEVDGGFPAGKHQWYFLDSNCTGLL